MSEVKYFRTRDLYVAAYLSLSTGFPALEKRDSGKIIFSFPSSSDLYRRLQAFNEGTQVDAGEFSRTIKTLRARMLEAKFGAGNE